MRRWTRCEGCRRWRVTAHQNERWSNWCELSGEPSRYVFAGISEPRWSRLRRRVLSELTMPLWWRLATRCMGWHDCVGPDESLAYYRDYPWWVRAMFGRPRMVATVEPEGSEG